MESYRKKLVEYFKRNLSKGYTVESLRWALVNQGYSRTDILMAVDQAHRELAEKAPVIKEKPTIKYEIYGDDDKLINVKIKRPFWNRFFG